MSERENECEGYNRVPREIIATAYIKVENLMVQDNDGQRI
jgi:hypothetical protein